MLEIIKNSITALESFFFLTRWLKNQIKMITFQINAVDSLWSIASFPDFPVSNPKDISFQFYNESFIRTYNISARINSYVMVLWNRFTIPWAYGNQLTGEIGGGKLLIAAGIIFLQCRSGVTSEDKLVCCWNLYGLCAIVNCVSIETFFFRVQKKNSVFCDLLRLNSQVNQILIIICKLI